MCCPALLAACGNHSGEAEHHSGIGLKLFRFIPDAVFTFTPESCSRSSRNTVRNHTGIAFTLPRIPHSSPESLSIEQRFAGQPTANILVRLVGVAAGGIQNSEDLRWQRTCSFWTWRQLCQDGSFLNHQLLFVSSPSPGGQLVGSIPILSFAPPAKRWVQPKYFSVVRTARVQAEIESGLDRPRGEMSRLQVRPVANDQPSY